MKMLLSESLGRAAAATRAGGLLMAVLCLCGAGCGKAPESPAAAPADVPVLRVLCGSSMAAPVEELARQFGAERGVRIETDLGGSETLLPKVLSGAKADVFVCHDPFEEKVKAGGRLTRSVAVGWLEPVVAVRPGNPKGLHSVKDLAGAGLKIGIGDPRYSTCGELFVKALRERGLEGAVMSNVVLQARSHAEVANGLVLGPLDTVVVWNFVARLYPDKLEVAPSGVVYPATRVTVLGLTGGDNAAGRDAFLDWCGQPAAVEVFRRHGYTREAQ